MPNVLVFSNNEVFKSDILDQIKLYAPEFNILNAEIDIADIIVIDQDRDMLDKVHKKNLKTPIIFLSNTDSSFNDSRIYQIDKPFSLNVFLDKIRALINIFENSADGTLEFNNYILRPSHKEILNLRNSEVTKLTEKEVAIIKYLYKNKGKNISKMDLMQEVWGYAADVATHTVETHIYRLRQKVEHDDGNAQLILTSEGGYQLKF